MEKTRAYDARQRARGVGEAQQEGRVARRQVGVVAVQPHRAEAGHAQPRPSPALRGTKSKSEPTVTSVLAMPSAAATSAARRNTPQDIVTLP